MDIDIKELVKDGISFRRIFVEIIIVSFATFLGFFWKDRITEILDLFIPQTSSILGRLIVGIGITIIIVLIVYFLIKSEIKYRGKANKHD